MGTVLSFLPAPDGFHCCVWKEGKSCTPWHEFLSPSAVPENTVYKVYNKKKRLCLPSIKSSSIYKSQGGERSSGNSVLPWSLAVAAGELWINQGGTAIPRIFWAALPCFPSQSSFGNTFRGSVFRGLHFLKGRSLQRARLFTSTAHHPCKPQFQALLGLHIPQKTGKSRKLHFFCFITSLHLISSEFRFQSLLLMIIFILWRVGLVWLCPANGTLPLPPNRIKP